MLEIVTCIVTPFQQNARLLVDSASRRVVLVDPGGEVPRLCRALETINPSGVDSIFLTHAHLDHGGGVAAALEYCGRRFGRTPPLMACGEEERPLRASLAEQALLFGLSAQEYQNVPEPDVVLRHGERLSVGEISGTILSTPGHSPGHLSLYFEEAPCRMYSEAEVHGSEPGAPLRGGREVGAPILIAGDTLFAGSIGRTDLPGGDHQQLLMSIRERLLTLPGHTCVLPGHGPQTTIDRERTTNPFLQ